LPRPEKTAIRRKDLVRATVLAIHRNRMAEPTMAQISACAGLASGSIVTHYFDSKDALLRETYRELSAEFLAEVILRTRAAASPMERVEAVVAAVFAPSQTTPEAVSAWLWFWSRAAIDPAFGQIERATWASVRDELAAALRAFVPKAAVGDAAEGLLALTYGLWLRFALDPAALGVDRAAAIAASLARTHLAAAAGDSYARVGLAASDQRRSIARRSTGLKGFVR
jgi:TetR/AcrR family transcriptional regulator, transcriptional repressor of bet genes